MKFSGSDFKMMRWNIAAISGSVILSAIILYASMQYQDHAQKELRAAQNQMKDARNRLNAAHQDQENLATYAKDYDALSERKLFGDDHRLDWMEGLEKLRQQNLAFDFHYNIAPQKTYAPQPNIDSGNFEIHYSETKLQFDLLHEGQLLNFFDAMLGRIKGQYQVEGCTMQRLGSNDGDSDDPDPAAKIHIKAECSGGWITLKNRNAQP